MAMITIIPPAFEGGTVTTYYNIEVLNIDSQEPIVLRLPASTMGEYEVLNLTAGARYKARACAENKVGCGPYSNWNSVLILPLSAADMVSMAADKSKADDLEFN